MLSKQSYICLVKLWQNDPQKRTNVVQYLHIHLEKLTQCKWLEALCSHTNVASRFEFHDTSQLGKKDFYLPEPRRVSSKRSTNKFLSCHSRYEHVPPVTASTLDSESCKTKSRLLYPSWATIMRATILPGGRNTMDLQKLHVQTTRAHERVIYMRELYLRETS